MKTKIKIKILKDCSDFKKGEIGFADIEYSKYLIKEGIAEKIDEEREKEAKFLVDKSTLETNKKVDKRTAEVFLKVKPENYERIVEEKYTLKDVHDIYKKNLYIEDTNRIDLVLAVALSSQLEGVPLWVILVGSSGDMKSVQLNALEGYYTFYLQKLTSKTLVNGFKEKNKYPDLAPKLNNKVVIIRDMATLIKLPPQEKAEIWGQLRDLYDGFAGTTSGMGTDVQYSNLKITLLAGSTPAIDNQVLIHQDLGTRELIYRVKHNKEKEKVMNKCMENEELEESIKKELNEVTTKFLFNCVIKRLKPHDMIIYQLQRMAMYLSYMRASAEFDYNNCLYSDVSPEEPTRIVKQLKRLFICLKSLDKDYPDEKALEILWELVNHSSNQNRVKVFRLLLSGQELSTSQVADILHLGKSTATRELNVLWNLGFIKLRRQEINSNTDRTYDYWSLEAENPNISFIKRP